MDRRVLAHTGRPLKQALFGFALFAVVQFLSIGIVSVNIIALASADIPVTAVTEALFAALSFFLLKKVAESKSLWEFAGYVVGATTGSTAAILLTRGLH